MARIGAVILAAGLSRRWGADNKLMASVDDVPMIVRTVSTVLASAARPAIVVLGHDADAIRAAVGEAPVEFCLAADFAAGMSASLKAGVAALPSDCDGALVCLGDMPWVRPGTLDGLVRAFDPADGALALVPTYGGSWGNPVLIGRGLFAEIANLSGDRGAKALLAAAADRVAEIPVDDPGILRDADRPEQLRKAADR